VAEQDDAGVSFLFGGEYSVAIRVEQIDDDVISTFSAAVLENANVGSLGKGLADALRQLNRAVMRIVVVDEPTDEADHNIRGSGWISGVNDGPIHTVRKGGSCRQNCQGDDQRTKWSEPAQERIPNQ